MTHEEEAFNINSKAVAALTDLCNNLGSRLIHISTDFVFDGNIGNYSEYDPPNPQSVYAKSKLQGELEARRAFAFNSSDKCNLRFPSLISLIQVISQYPTCYVILADLTLVTSRGIKSDFQELFYI